MVKVGDQVPPLKERNLTNGFLTFQSFSRSFRWSQRFKFMAKQGQNNAKELDWKIFGSEIDFK